MTLFDELHAKREQILALAARYGVADVRVFGSVARGEETPDSDVDFLIRIARDRSLMDLIGFKQDAEELLARECDVISENGIHRLLRETILAEAKPL